LLGSTGPILGDPETVAGIMLLEAWAQAKGLNALSRKLLWLAEQLLIAGGTIVDGLSMEPTPNFRSWDTAAEMAIGPAWKSPVLPWDEVSKLRSIWIEFWSRHRVAQAVLVEKWHRKDHDRDLEQFARLPVGAHRRPILPTVQPLGRITQPQL
jgi:hypothetical protein